MFVIHTYPTLLIYHNAKRIRRNTQYANKYSHTHTHSFIHSFTNTLENTFNLVACNINLNEIIEQVKLVYDIQH